MRNRPPAPIDALSFSTLFGFAAYVAKIKTDRYKKLHPEQRPKCAKDFKQDESFFHNGHIPQTAGRARYRIKLGSIL